MYQVKRRGGASHQVIDLRLQRLAEHRTSLERALRGALRRQELRTAYQPIVRTSDGLVRGAEALLRWDHPSEGPVLPTTVIPLAEQSGLINDIGRWVLERACTDRHRWTSSNGHGAIGIAVNVSTHQLMAPEFATLVAEVLVNTDTDPDLLTLEVTEGVFLRDADRALVVLRELKELGVKLALDDFGTGYSSLGYLKEFPVDIVKIDRRFIADMQHDAASHAIVSAVIELAHRLHLTVTSEGVETPQQRDGVATLGSECCQGFYFGRPMTVDDLAALTS